MNTNSIPDTITVKTKAQICLLQLLADLISTPEMTGLMKHKTIGTQLVKAHEQLLEEANKLGITPDGKAVLQEMAKAIWRVTEFCLESDSPSRLVVFNAILDSYAKGEIHYGDEHEEVMGKLATVS